MNQQYKKRLLVNAGEKIRTVFTEEVAYFYSMEKSSFLCTKDNRNYQLELSLEKLEEILNPDEFFRINRQFIVHISSLDKIFILSKSRIKVSVIPAPPTNEDVYVSNGKASAFRKWLDA